MGSTDNWQVTAKFRNELMGNAANKKVETVQNSGGTDLRTSTGTSAGNKYVAANPDYDTAREFENEIEPFAANADLGTSTTDTSVDEPAAGGMSLAELNNLKIENSGTIKHVWGDDNIYSQQADAKAAAEAAAAAESKANSGMNIIGSNQKIWETKGNTYTVNNKDYKMEKGHSTSMNLTKNPQLEKMLGFMELQKSNHNKLSATERKAGTFDHLSFESIKPQGRPGEKLFTITDHSSGTTRDAWYNIGKNTSKEGFQDALNIQSFNKFQNSEQKKWHENVRQGNVSQASFADLNNIIGMSPNLSAKERAKMLKDLQKKDKNYRLAIGGSGSGTNAYKWGTMQGEPTQAQKIEQKLMIGEKLSPREQKQLDVLKGNFGVGSKNPAADWTDFY